MKKLVAAIVALFGLAAPSQAQEGQVSHYQSRSVELETFDSVAVAGAFHVSVMVSDRPSQVHLSGPPQLLADAVAEVEDGRLLIHFREGAEWSWNPGSGMHALVVVPRLTEVLVGGPTRMEVFGAEGESFEASIFGAGSINLRRMNVGEARFVTRGSGGIVAEGTARDGVFATAGAGSIDAKRLRVANADITSAGAGSVLADVSGLANVTLLGSGDADIVGGAECVVQEFGSGSAECR